MHLIQISTPSRITYWLLGNFFILIMVNILPTIVMSADARPPAIILAGQLKENRYLSEYGYFSVDLPSTMDPKDLFIKEHNLNNFGERIVVTFGPTSPSNSIFTVQVANIDEYAIKTNTSPMRVFDKTNSYSINEFNAFAFILHIFSELRLSMRMADKLVSETFTHQGNEVLYAVFEQDPGYLNNHLHHDTLYHAFYFTVMNNRGVLVWIQIPIWSNGVATMLGSDILERKWDVQNAFFNSITVNN